MYKVQKNKNEGISTVLKNIEDLKEILKDILGYISKLYKQQLEFTYEKLSELYTNQEK